LGQSRWRGAGKTKRNGSGFSSTKPAAAPKAQFAKRPANHATKEQKARALINQGSPQEAEAIHREPITTGTKNRAIYVNLAAAHLMQASMTRPLRRHSKLSTQV
jgi:hypothetical protein